MIYMLCMLQQCGKWKSWRILGILREKHDVNKNIKKITNPMKKSIGNMKKVTAKLLSVK